ncbi:MAG: hypothetical protein ACI9KE_003602 [Polyangiales bacterium]|jgi:hypothetical protein
MLINKVVVGVTLVVAGCGGQLPQSADCIESSAGSSQRWFTPEPEPLTVRLIADFHCDSDRTFEVRIDGREAGTITVPCPDSDVTVIQAPPPSYVFHSAPLAPGAHILWVADVSSQLQRELEIVLPALVVTHDGAGVLSGSIVRVWVDEEIRIFEPTAMPVMGM